MHLKSPSARTVILSSLTLFSSIQATINDASQKPLIQPQQPQHHPPSSSTLNFSSPSPHILHSTSSLLSQWPNTFHPNGHTLASVTVPAYTHFYHGRTDSLAPPSPEWLAFDLEMSYGIMGSSRNSFLLTYQTTREVKMLYFDGESAALMGLGQLDSQMLLVWGNVTGPEREKDGEGDGGRLGGGGLWGEYMRAKGLCGWLRETGLGGRGWGFEGVVRMNAGFEAIWCDFSSESLRLIGWRDVTAPLDSEEEDNDDGMKEEEAEVGEKEKEVVEERDTDATSYYPLPPAPTRTDISVDPSEPALPPNWRRNRNKEPFLFSQGWAWFDSATWHYGSSGNGPGRGETRAKVDSCATLSFYSPQFVNQSLNRAVYERKELNLTDDGLWEGKGRGNRTLALQQLARRRRYHHLGDVIPEEAALMRTNAERALRGMVEGGRGCSGADWMGITSEIVQQTSMRIKMLEMHFTAFEGVDMGNSTSVKRWLHGFRAEMHGFAVGYLKYPNKTSETSWAVGGELYNETHSRCRYHYTRLMVPEEGVSLLPEEGEQRRAVEEVQGAICSVMLGIGFGAEGTWVELFGKGRTREQKRTPPSLTKRVTAWHDDLSLLRAWLGWESEFTGCKTVCAWDERCHIPMWPLSRGGRGPPPPRRGDNSTEPPHPPGHRGPPPHDQFPPNGTNPGKPGFEMPPRGPWSMGDDTDLWEPKCVKAGYIMAD